MNNIKECLKRIDNKNYLTEREHKEYLKNIENGLDRLEQYDKSVKSRCDACVNCEGNICVGMNAPICIETLLNCKEMMIYDCEITIKELQQKNKEVKLSEIIKVLEDAGFNKNFIKKKREFYNKSDEQPSEHIEVWNGIFVVKIMDIWNGKIESLRLNATEPAFSKIFHWASIQANIINDLEEKYLSSQKK